jgi:hypothetical protein
MYKLALVILLAFTGIIGNGITDVFESEKAWGAVISDEDLPFHAQNWMAQMEGEGTAKSPKIIRTAEDLARVAVIVNHKKNFLAEAIFGKGSAMTDQSVHLRLGNDIDLANYRDNWIDPRGVPQTHGWVPIGKKEANFGAHFDGRTNIIANLRVNDSGSKGVGLFGWCEGATISYLNIMYADVEGARYVGGLVGVGKNTQIMHSKVFDANIRGRDVVGGLIGRSKIFNRIVGSYASGSVRGNDSVGGLVGRNDHIVVDSEANTAVSGTNCVGGIAGIATLMSTVENSQAFGNVVGVKSETGFNLAIGGLVGMNCGKIENCNVSGNVYNTCHIEHIHELVGMNISGTIQNSHFHGSLFEVPKNEILTDSYAFQNIDQPFE